MRVSFAQVEPVSGLAGSARTHDHVRNALFFRPLLGFGYELAADAGAAVRFCYNQAANFAIGFALQVVTDAEVNPSDERVHHAGKCLGQASDVHNVVRPALQLYNALRHGFRRHGIAEFTAQLSNGSGVRDGDLAENE